MKIKKIAACMLAGALVCALSAGCGDSKGELILIGEDGSSLMSDVSEEENASSDDAKEENGELASGTQTAEEGTPSEIYVYICGEVSVPGVYVLKSGARLCDAVEAAGGMTDNASRTYWNLARVLEDGEMIYVPTIEEAAERDFSELASSEEDSGQEPGGISEDGRVNINTATEEQLMTVPGIGEAKAKSIIAYREENGSFNSIEDIVNVSGIKDGLFQQIKDYITVD